MNDQYRMTWYAILLLHPLFREARYDTNWDVLLSNGTGYQTSCITGTVYHTPGDSSPISNFQCWPSWTGGNWDATQTITELQLVGVLPNQKRNHLTESPRSLSPPPL